MQDEWPTQAIDMQVAKSIIDKYYLINEGEPLSFLEITLHQEDNDKKFELKMPEWLVELQNYFRHEYGYEHGHAVISKVLTKFLLRYETLH